jgi:hypothetical protein
MADSLFLTDSDTAAMATTDTGPEIVGVNLDTSTVTYTDAGATLTLGDLP